MKQIGIFWDELSHIRLLIQGFNRDKQRALGKLELCADDIKLNSLFHVTDAKKT